MSMNLAELGREICKEFDQRNLDLNTLHSEIRTKVVKDRKELVQMRNVDIADQETARSQVLQDTSSLLNKYKAERKVMVQGLRADRASQVDEMKTWVNERGEELKGWYEAGGYLFRKRTGR